MELGDQRSCRHPVALDTTPSHTHAPPPSSGPSSRCPGAGSRMGTCRGPFPSCPVSAGSVLPGPGVLAAAQTPGVHPLPQGEMGLSPPSGWTDGASVRAPGSIDPLSAPGQDRPPLTTFWREKRARSNIQAWEPRHLILLQPQQPRPTIEGSGIL